MSDELWAEALIAAQRKDGARWDAARKAIVDEVERPWREELTHMARFRHDEAHNGDVYRGGDFPCDLCPALLNQQGNDPEDECCGECYISPPGKVPVSRCGCAEGLCGMDNCPYRQATTVADNDVGAWDCRRCGQRNSGWASECGRCEWPGEPATKQPPVEHEGEPTTEAGRTLLLDIVPMHDREGFGGSIRLRQATAQIIAIERRAKAETLHDVLTTLRPYADTEKAIGLIEGVFSDALLNQQGNDRG